LRYHLNQPSDNIKKLKFDKGYEETRKRLEKMARDSKKQGKDVYIDPDISEVRTHIGRYSIVCKFWKGQGVWVIGFEQIVMAFATKLLSMEVEEEKHHSKFFRWLRVHFRNQQEELYEQFLQGMKARNLKLGDRWLDLEPDPDYEDEEEEDESPAPKKSKKSIKKLKAKASQPSPPKPKEKTGKKAQKQKKFVEQKKKAKLSKGKK
jgi:hypothetical protein